MESQEKHRPEGLNMKSKDQFGVKVENASEPVKYTNQHGIDVEIRSFKRWDATKFSEYVEYVVYAVENGVRLCLADGYYNDCGGGFDAAKAYADRIEF